MVDCNNRRLADLVRLNYVRHGGRVPQTSVGIGNLSNPGLPLPRRDRDRSFDLALPSCGIVEIHELVLG